jgi:hypothetical protein
MSPEAREEIITEVMELTGHSRRMVAAEVDRQLEEAEDGFAGETVEEAVGVLAFYTSRGLYDQVREAEARRLGIRETLDDLVEAERDKLAATEGAITGENRRKAVARLAGKLLRRSQDPFLVQELIETWAAVKCRPIMPASEVKGIVDWMAARELQRLGAAT